jgi:hypothetical protein
MGLQTGKSALAGVQENGGMDMATIEGAGGTPGGIYTFVFGLGMTIGGGFLFVNHVRVGYSFRHYFGRSTHGLMLIPLLIGIGFLFFNSKSIVGWALAGGGALIILLGIITSLRFSFPQTSLFNLLVMLVMLVGGIGLMLRSLRAVK